MDSRSILLSILSVALYTLFAVNALGRYNLVNKALSSLPFRLNNLALWLIASACFLAHGYLNYRIGTDIVSPPRTVESCGKPFLEVARIISFVGLWLGILSLSTTILNYLSKQMLFQNSRLTNVCFMSGFAYPAICILLSMMQFYNSKGEPSAVLGAINSIPQILAPYIVDLSFFALS